VRVRVTVFDGEQYDGGWPSQTADYSPARLVDVIAWFQAKLDAIPPEHRSTATCGIDSSSGHEGEHYGHIEIHYERPATAEEITERRRQKMLESEKVKEKELATLKALQAKYGAM
jgi:hypothetical protein